MRADLTEHPAQGPGFAGVHRRSVHVIEHGVGQARVAAGTRGGHDLQEVRRTQVSGGLGRQSGHFVEPALRAPRRREAPELVIVTPIPKD
jgi:hypothetical protein